MEKKIKAKPHVLSLYSRLKKSGIIGTPIIEGNGLQIPLNDKYAGLIMEMALEEGILEAEVGPEHPAILKKLGAKFKPKWSIVDAHYHYAVTGKGGRPRAVAVNVVYADGPRQNTKR